MRSTCNLFCQLPAVVHERDLPLTFQIIWKYWLWWDKGSLQTRLLIWCLLSMFSETSVATLTKKILADALQRFDVVCVHDENSRASSHICWVNTDVSRKLQPKWLSWCIDLWQQLQAQTDYSGVNGCFKLQINNELPLLLCQYAGFILMHSVWAWGWEDREVQRNGMEFRKWIPAIPKKKSKQTNQKNRIKLYTWSDWENKVCDSPIFKLARAEPRSCRWFSHSLLLSFQGTELPGELDSLILSGTSPICPHTALTQHGPHRVIA